MFPWAKLPKSLGRVGESLWRSRLPGLGAFDCEPSAGKPPSPSHPCLSWRGAAYQSHWIRVPPLALTVCRVVVLAPPDIARETRLERGGKRVPAPSSVAGLGWQQRAQRCPPRLRVRTQTVLPVCGSPLPRVLRQSLFLLPLVRVLLGLFAFSRVYCS